MKGKPFFRIFLVLAVFAGLAISAFSQTSYMSANFKSQGKLKGNGPNGQLKLAGFFMSKSKNGKGKTENSVIVTYSPSTSQEAHGQLTRAEKAKELATNVTISVTKEVRKGQSKVIRQIVLTNAIFWELPEQGANTQAKITYAKIETKYPQQKTSGSSSGGYNRKHR
ncbi:MAG TPA: hypothetical protein VGL56_10545 [Fimbriimonadaceae bacterium]|jgi:hypothetical protein